MTRYFRRREAVFVVLLASMIIPTVPGLAEWLGLAWELRSLSMRARRESLFGDLYRGVEALRRVPESTTLALIRVAPKTSDNLFINYYLFPHPTRTYVNRAMYAMSDEKTRPNVIVQVGAGAPRIVTYAALRDFELRKSRVLQRIPLPAEARTAFAIPLVTSVDGRQTYTIEGALDSSEETRVTLTLQPGGIVKILTIRGTRPFYDLLYQCFGRMQFAAWVGVVSDKPVRAAFWLVNRDAKTAAPIRLIDGPIKKPAQFPADVDTKLWLVNLGDRPAEVRAGTAEHTVPAHDLSMVDATGTVSGRVYAFLSRNKPDGSTEFTWPEDVK